MKSVLFVIRRLLTLICLIAMVLSSNVRAQDRARILMNIPDIPGYQTLLCDFHMHTVFSDGTAWPSIRVEQAWRQGLDAVAITDHLEYLPHSEEIKKIELSYYVQNLLVAPEKPLAFSFSLNIE